MQVSSISADLYIKVSDSYNLQYRRFIAQICYFCATALSFEKVEKSQGV